MGSEEITTSPESRTHLKEMLAIGAIASAIGIAVVLLIDWFPTSASEQAGPIDTLWDVLGIVSVPIFVLVTVIVLYCAWRFRMKPGEELKDGPPIHGNTKLEIIWTAIPAILMVVLCSYAFVVLTDIEEADANSNEVRVVGEQFTWTFYYTDPESDREFASPQLYVPLGRQTNFTIQSKDVIHDFWVPAFRMKIDAVPGIDTHLRVTPDRVGEYPVVCAELCGIGHAVMRQTAHVLTPEDYERWLREAAAQSAGGAGGQEEGEGGGTGPVDGKELFAGDVARCGACHALADAGTAGGVGPNLDDVLAGDTADSIRESIVNPDAEITEGYSPGIMPPNYGQTLSPDQIDALATYLDDVTG